MPLTPEEIGFLRPYCYEYSTICKWDGPACTLLRARGIKYWDIKWMMEAYFYIDPPRIVTVTTPDGTSEILEIGRQVDSVPECPWPDAETARRRDDEIEPELQAKRLARSQERAE